MNRHVLVLAALAMFAMGTATTAKAVEFNVGPGSVDVGPGGVYVGPHRHHGYRDYDSYNEYRGDSCRVVIDHRTNRFGEDVTVRRRICD